MYILCTTVWNALPNKLRQSSSLPIVRNTIQVAIIQYHVHMTVSFPAPLYLHDIMALYKFYYYYY